MCMSHNHSIYSRCTNFWTFWRSVRMSALLNHLRAQPDANSLLPHENETYAYDSPFKATPSLPTYMKRSMSLTATGEKSKQNPYSTRYLLTPNGGLRRSMSSSYVPTDLTGSPGSSLLAMYQTPITSPNPQNSAQYSTTSSAASVSRFLRAIPSLESSPQAPSPSGMAIDYPVFEADSPLYSDPKPLPVSAAPQEGTVELSGNTSTSFISRQDLSKTSSLVDPSDPLPLPFTPDRSAAFPVNPPISPLRFTTAYNDVDIPVLCSPQPTVELPVSDCSTSSDHVSTSLVSSPLPSFPSTVEHSPSESSNVTPTLDSSETSQNPGLESPDLFRNTFSMDPVLATPRRTRSATAAARLISEAEIKPDTTIPLTLPPPAKRKRADETTVPLEAASSKIVTRRTRAQTQIQASVSRAVSVTVASERVRTKTAPVQMSGKENQKEEADMVWVWFTFSPSCCMYKFLSFMYSESNCSTLYTYISIHIRPLYQLIILLVANICNVLYRELGIRCLATPSDTNNLASPALEEKKLLE